MLLSWVCLFYVELLYIWKNYYVMIYNNGCFCNGKDLYMYFFKYFNLFFECC